MIRVVKVHVPSFLKGELRTEVALSGMAAYTKWTPNLSFFLTCIFAPTEQQLSYIHSPTLYPFFARPALGKTWTQVIASPRWWWLGMNLAALGVFWLLHDVASWRLGPVKIVCVISLGLLITSMFVSCCHRQLASDWWSAWHKHVVCVVGCWVWFVSTRSDS